VVVVGEGVSLLTRDTSPQIFGQFKSEINDKMYSELKFMIYAKKLTRSASKLCSCPQRTFWRQES
jgi:hypothetical protein